MCVGSQLALAPSFGDSAECLWTNRRRREAVLEWLAGIELLSYSTGPLLGQARAGGVAAAWSIRGSIVSGGVLCIAAVASFTATLPAFRHYDARTNEHAVRERERRARAAADGAASAEDGDGA